MSSDATQRDSRGLSPGGSVSVAFGALLLLYFACPYAFLVPLYWSLSRSESSGSFAVVAILFAPVDALYRASAPYHHYIDWQHDVLKRAGLVPHP